MIQFEIFATTFPSVASDKLNSWIKNHPDAKILEFQYQHARFGDHSICIMYETE